MKDSANGTLHSLNFLLAFFVPSVIFASRAKPPLEGSGHSKLWTSTLRCLPHLPFPFLAPSHSLPLCIFKPVKLPQPHPPHPLCRGRRQGPPPVPAPVGLLLGLGLGEAGDRPQAREIWKVWEINHRLWEQSPLGWGPLGTCQQLSGGLASRLGGCRESGLRAGGFILSLSAGGCTGCGG